MDKKQQTETAQHTQPLPRVHSTAAFLVRGSALLLVLSVIGLPIDFALGGNDAVSALLEVTEILSLLVLVIAWLFRRGEKKAIPRILADQRTIHWTYNSTEWQHFTTQSWRRSTRYNVILAGITLGMLLIAGVLSFLNTQGSLDNAVFLIITIGCCVFALFLVSFLHAVYLLWWRRRHTSTDVYLHRTGIIMSGWYYSLGGMFGRLNKITYLAGDPGMLRFNIGSGRNNRVLEVPVPRSREAEAEHVARSLPFS